jgi:hypothetical protein
MTRSDRGRAPRWRRAGGAALSVAALAAGCSGTTGSAPAPPRPAAGEITHPIATSLETPSGIWATTAMGDPSDRRNTFWQLFHRRAGSPAWTDDVEATAAATNGGVVFASEGSRFVAGVLPSQALTFSPLVASSDGGKTWQNGVVPGGLMFRPNALGVSAGGQTLALTGGGSAPQQVLSSPAGMTGWQQLVTVTSLARSPAAAGCGVTSLDAVALAGNIPVLGTTCARKGTAGIFVYADGAWHAAGPAPPSPGGSTITVLALRAAGAQIEALLGAAADSGTTLAAAWSVDLGATWQVSPPQLVVGSRPIQSVGPAGPAGFFALFPGPSGALELRAIASPGSDWSVFPDPPADSQTAVFSTDVNSPEAVAGSRTVMTVWNLESGSWVKGQTLPVQISFGSSG